MDMTLIPTSLILIAAALWTLAAGWMGSRPPNPNRGPRMMPWRFLMLLGFTLALLMLVHLLNLLGFHTGQNQPRY